jgi:UDP-N-acetylmuramoyl-L-alanyl-D-glutamate--2,6-diaminopimelate ligase
MILSELLQGAGIASSPAPDIEITSIVADSRKVVPGCLFVALRGTKFDGNAFADAALEAGAAAILTDCPRCQEQSRRVLVDSVATALGPVLRQFHGAPDQDLKVFGVTGTNGKTTTAFLIEAMLEEGGLRPALLSTVTNRWPGFQSDAVMTTPDSIALWESLAQAKAAGAASLAMEVSSHALHQERVAGLMFDGAVFTNLTRDHLDYHGSYESYFAAKSRLFTRHLKADACAVVNLDDPHGRILKRQMKDRVQGFSFDAPDADFLVRDLRLELTGLSFRLEGRGLSFELKSPLLGRVFAQNLAGAAIAAMGMGVSPEAIVRACARVRVPGRCELVNVGGLTGIVDYAHTPDALERLLEGLRPQVPGRLICVFGCGGDRDRGKRPLMGEIAARLSDLAVVTSDNPRSEDPGAIVDEILSGISRGNCERVVDRHEAIQRAVQGLCPGDLVVVAGKGHEKTQTIAAVAHAFDDAQVLRTALEAV